MKICFLSLNFLAKGFVMSSTIKKEIIFVLDNLVDLRELIDAKTNAKIVVLDSKTDPLTQIATALKGVKNLDAIHIFSHGSEGELQFANGSINNANLSSYKSQLLAGK